MQQQKTESYQQPDDLPALNQQEEKFIELIAGGANQTEAYKIAYSATGYSSAALRVQACRKVAQPDIQAHLRAIRAAGVATHRLTVEDRIEQEMAFAQECKDAGNFGAAGAAYDRVNKLKGLYVERFEDISVMDPLQTLASIAQHSPELARKLAHDNGIALALPSVTLDNDKPAPNQVN